MQRANPLNDPKFKNEQGYNVYDLNNQQIVTPRFGEYTPICVAETVPGDRHLLHTNVSSVLEQIDAKLLSEVNEYHDHVFVPMRCIFPINYEKIVTNPTKGDDIPWRALPQIPLLRFLQSVFDDLTTVITRHGQSLRVDSTYFDDGVFNAQEYQQAISEISEGTEDNITAINFYSFFNKLLYVCTVLSRGQLLDYLGYCPELQGPKLDARGRVKLEESINRIFSAFGDVSSISSYKLSSERQIIISNEYRNSSVVTEDLSLLRSTLYDVIEAGEYFEFTLRATPLFEDIASDIQNVYTFVSGFNDVIDASDPFADGSYINPMRIAAYQLMVAEYCTNDHVDNVYTSQLWMQNLRSIMFPTDGNFTYEPTFDYNGVATEYDLLSTGAFDAFMNASHDHEERTYLARCILLINQLFVLRRSLRYGDYFSTGRPNLVAVGQLAIPVNNTNDVLSVNPVDTVRSLVVQRFINAVNWIGSKFVNYMASLFGVKPSYTDPHPVYVAHRKIQLGRDNVTNTADNQGKIRTNLLGETGSQAIDVFIDDYGVLLGVVSYDALPIYTTGIDRNFTNSDRFSMFNPMLQNVGDQEIAVSELLGFTGFVRVPFAYTARYSQYKFGISRAHGAAVNLLPGYFMKYPPQQMFLDGVAEDDDYHINPDFIRDKPFYFDQFFDQLTGFGFGSYYHFIASVTNVHSAARKMMYQPPVL